MNKQLLFTALVGLSAAVQAAAPLVPAPQQAQAPATPWHRTSVSANIDDLVVRTPVITHNARHAAAQDTTEPSGLLQLAEPQRRPPATYAPQFPLH